MPKRRLAPLKINELRNLLEVEPRFRKELSRLRLKLTVNARIVAIKRSRCEPPHFKPTFDPIILKRGALKSGK